ncbi:hypothetical protein SCP_0600160 [Sparassis crispa]|uniref:Uncharacterized protein n=1 Tax=Sparassis crispa TaxID=139825 RepID=A0A401GPG1_9APHY|nr:hypothetical protein SCP_0600160 [Sparassis crispa]GBE84039.1 hypothetical protein SCP_0600160 [Sparassis crispa]
MNPWLLYYLHHLVDNKFFHETYPRSETEFKQWDEHLSLPPIQSFETTPPIPHQSCRAKAFLQFRMDKNSANTQSSRTARDDAS